MKKKLILLVATLLCVVTLLASCAPTMKLKSLVGDGTYHDDAPTLTVAEKLQMQDMTSTVVGDLAVFKQTAVSGLSNYTVYNLVTNTGVWSGNDSTTASGTDSSLLTHTVTPTAQHGTTWFTVESRTTTQTTTDGSVSAATTYTYSLRNAAGVEFATATGKSPKPAASVEDLIHFDGKVYRVAEDGSIAYAFDKSELSSLPAVTKAGEFYVDLTGNSGVAIYDASLNLLSTLYLPSYANLNAYSTVEELSNGNVLIQYSVAKDLMAEDYTYLVDNGPVAYKYDLFSYLLVAKTGKVKELKLDFLVSYVDYRPTGADNWFYDDKIDNLAEIYYIEDQRVNISNAAATLVSLSNKGKIKGEIAELIPGMDVTAGVQLVATNRWLVRNLEGQRFLLNEKGETLGEVTNINLNEATPVFFVANDKIYDWDLNVKCDMGADGARSYTVMTHGVIFTTDAGETKLYTGGEVKTLITKADAAKYTLDNHLAAQGLFVISERTDEGKIRMHLYNDVGTELTVIENVQLGDRISCVASAESTNAVLLSYTELAPDAGSVTKKIYYRVG